MESFRTLRRRRHSRCKPPPALDIFFPHRVPTTKTRQTHSHHIYHVYLRYKSRIYDLTLPSKRRIFRPGPSGRVHGSTAPDVMGVALVLGFSVFCLMKKICLADILTIVTLTAKRFSSSSPELASATPISTSGNEIKNIPARLSNKSTQKCEKVPALTVLVARGEPVIASAQYCTSPG